MSRAVVTVTTGEAGSGKSYARCARFLPDRFLRDGEGVHWSTFPLGEVPQSHAFPPAFEGETFVDRIAEKVSRETGQDAGQVARRVQLIPAEVLATWQAEESGPWEFFEGQDLNGAHIAIDEAHNYVGPDSSPKQRKRWRQWLGELRHQGASVEFLSQSLAKVPLDLRREAGLHIECKNTETERDPFFRIELGDWYELRAGFLTGRYRSAVLESERRSAMGEGRGWTSRRLWPFEVEYFALYDSFSAPQAGGSVGTLQRRQFERRSKLGLLLWFLGKNAGRVVPRVALVAFVGWLLFGAYLGLGGAQSVMRYAMARFLGGQSEAAESTVGAIEGAGEMADGASTEVQGPEVSEDLAREVNLLGRVLAGVPPEVVLQAVAELRRRLQLAEAEVDRLTAASARSTEVVMMGPRWVMLRDGWTYGVGEKIGAGPHVGATVVQLDWPRRVAVLDTGAQLRLAPPAPVGAPGGVSGYLVEPIGSGLAGIAGELR